MTKSGRDFAPDVSDVSLSKTREKYSPSLPENPQCEARIFL